MLRLLVVDDEELIRKGLIKIIGRCGDGYRVIGEAENGLDALEIIRKDRPDVVITDIKMPRMDGLELIRNLEISNTDIRKVVLSGFDEFNYVRETMRRGALDYLLKPVDEEQLAALLKKIQEDIDRENERRLNETSIRARLDESFPLLKDQFLHELIRENQLPEDEIRARFETYGIRVNAGVYRVLIVSVDNYHRMYEKLGAREARLKTLIVRKTVEDTLEGLCTFFSCFMEHDLAVVLSAPAGEPAAIDRVVDTLFANLRDSVGVRFSVSVGTPVDSLAELGSSCRDALTLLKTRFYHEGSSVLRSGKDGGRTDAGVPHEPVFFRERFETELKNCVELADPVRVRKVIGELCRNLAECRYEPEEALKLLSETYMKMQLSFPEFGKAAGTLYGCEYSYARVLDLYDTLDEIRKYTASLYGDIIREVMDIRRRKDRKLVEVVKEYVEKHYGDDITLATIADLVCLTPGYVCDLFKAQTGEHFVEFLTRVRMEKARELLKDVKVKIFEVGLMVGYEDATYFSKVFRKVVGISPREYRDLVC